MTQSRPPSDDALEVALANARNAPPTAPDDLMARVMADALAAMPEAVRPSLWRQLLGALGGWPAMAGLAATASIGIWVGGVLSDDLVTVFGPTESAALDTGTDLGTFDLLLVDG